MNNNNNNNNNNNCNNYNKPIAEETTIDNSWSPRETDTTTTTTSDLTTVLSRRSSSNRSLNWRRRIPSRRNSFPSRRNCSHKPTNPRIPTRWFRSQRSSSMPSEISSNPPTDLPGAGEEVVCILESFLDPSKPTSLPLFSTTKGTNNIHYFRVKIYPTYYFRV